MTELESFEMDTPLTSGRKKKFFQSFWLLVTSITSRPPAHCRNHTTTHSLSISDFPSSAWEGFNEPGTALFRSLRRCLHLRVWDAVNAQKYCIHACGLNRHCFNVGWEGFCCLLLIIYMVFIVLYIYMYIYLSERIHLLMLKLLPHMNLYTIKFTLIRKTGNREEPRKMRGEINKGRKPLEKGHQRKTDLEGIGPSENVL